MMEWSDLFAAIALMLVLEGIVPFVKPSAARDFMRKFETMADRQLRIIGFVSMLIGLALLFAAR